MVAIQVKLDAGSNTHVGSICQVIPSGEVAWEIL